MQYQGQSATHVLLTKDVPIATASTPVITVSPSGSDEDKEESKGSASISKIYNELETVQEEDKTNEPTIN